MTPRIKRYGHIAAIAALPLLVALPAQAGGLSYGGGYGYWGGQGRVHSHVSYSRHYGHSYRKWGGRHRHHGGRGAAYTILGLGIGYVLGSAITESRYDRDHVIVRERVVAAPNPGTGWYQPPPQPAPVPQAASAGQGSCLQTREYQTTVVVGGEEVEAYGTACLQPDGAWKFGPPTPVPY